MGPFRSMLGRTLIASAERQAHVRADEACCSLGGRSIQNRNSAQPSGLFSGADHDLIDHANAELGRFHEMHPDILEPPRLGKQLLELPPVAEVLSPVEVVVELPVVGFLRLRSQHVQHHQLSSFAEELRALLEQSTQVVVGKVVGRVGDQHVVEGTAERELILEDVQAVELVIGPAVLASGERDAVSIDVDAYVVEVAEDAGHVSGRAADLQDSPLSLDEAAERPLLLAIGADESHEDVPQAHLHGDFFFQRLDP